jgi:hypothetical protein
MALILGAGAIWTTAAAPHDPTVMGPTAAWLWLTTVVTIHRRGAKSQKRRWYSGSHNDPPGNCV